MNAEDFVSLLMNINASRAKLDDSDALLGQLLARAEDTISQLRIGVPLSYPIEGGTIWFEKINKRWRFTFCITDEAESTMVCDLPRELRIVCIGCLGEFIASIPAQLEAKVEQRQKILEDTKLVIQTIEEFQHEQKAKNA